MYQVISTKILINKSSSLSSLNITARITRSAENIFETLYRTLIICMSQLRFAYNQRFSKLVAFAIFERSLYKQHKETEQSKQQLNIPNITQPKGNCVSFPEQLYSIDLNAPVWCIKTNREPPLPPIL